MQIAHVATAHTPDTLAERLRRFPGLVVLRSGRPDLPQSRYSFLATRPFLTFRARASRCEIRRPNGETTLQFGNPWELLDAWAARFELTDEVDLPFPLGGCFGYWGYDLKNFVEPKLRQRAATDLEVPDCLVGFYSSLVVFDHHLESVWIVSTGLREDGARDAAQALRELDFWQAELASEPDNDPSGPARETNRTNPQIHSNLSREGFVSRVQVAQDYIQRGHIYQVNLAHRLAATPPPAPWDLFRALTETSPAPFAAWIDGGDFQIASSSPELFLRLSGRAIQTRPIKGTRPRGTDATRDAQLMYELRTSAKEMAELVMITDLLRNDLGRVCEFGSVQVPDLARLERFAHVQHLVSTVEGRLRPNVTHFAAFASCFPGGSVTGAPKFRAMEIIEELEPLARGPYTGAIGYLGFNRESQLSIAIRTAVCTPHAAYFHVGAGIVADSDPEAEYQETLAKAAGFLAATQGRLTAHPHLNHVPD